MPAGTPVDYDPFAPKVAAPVAPKSVDYDPFHARLKPDAVPVPPSLMDKVSHFAKVATTMPRNIIDATNRRAKEGFTEVGEGLRQMGNEGADASEAPFNLVGGALKAGTGAWNASVGGAAGGVAEGVAHSFDKLSDDPNMARNAGDFANMAAGVPAIAEGAASLVSAGGRALQRAKGALPVPEAPSLGEVPKPVKGLPKTPRSKGPEPAAPVPVDYDPFQPVIEGEARVVEPPVKGVPVDHDPFAPVNGNGIARTDTDLEPLPANQDFGDTAEYTTPPAANEMLTRPFDPNHTPADEAGFGFAPANEPRPAAMAAEREAPPPEPTLEAPPAEGEAGPVVGNEPDPVERADNALYRVARNKEADKAKMQNFLKATPKEMLDPKLQEDLTHAIEAKMVDPSAEIPPELQPAADHFRPLYEEQTDLINRKRALSDEDADPYDYDTGYVARRVEGHTPLFDDSVGPGRGDPILSGKPGLTQTAQAEKQRTAGFMVTDADGATHFSPEPPAATDILDRPYADVRPATIKEIEANTDVRYHKNALLNTVDNVMRLRSVVRNLEVLDTLKKDLVSQGLAHRDEWTFKGEDGMRNVVQSPNKAPEGFRGVPEVPQLKGMSFAPHIAEVLEDYFHKATPGSAEAVVEDVGKLNRLLTSAMFITPIPHVANVGVHWGIGRGFDWVKPSGIKSLLLDVPKAMKEVLTLGPKYRELIREGMGGQYISTATRNFQKVMLNAAGKKMAADPEMMNIFAKAANIPVAAVKAAYAASSKALWYGNDVMLMQRVLELERKGMSTREAIYEAEREIPNYRIPPRIGGTGAGKGGRYASVLLQSQAVGLFGRYKYGAARAWAALIKDLAKGDLNQRTEAVGKALVAIVMATQLYPAADWVAQKVTGNKNARWKRSGGLGMTDAIYNVATGDKDPSQATGSFFSPGPAGAAATGLIGNHDYYGNDIRTKGAPAWFQAGEAAKYAAGQTFPGQLAEKALAGKGDDALSQLAGLSLPTDKSVQAKAKYKGRDKVYAAKVVGKFKNRVKAGKTGEAIDRMGRR